MTTSIHHETPVALRSSSPCARDLVQRYDIALSPPALALLRADEAPPEFFARLVGENNWRDARHFLAHALPVRRALWWSCLCAHDVCDDCQPELAEAIATVARYVQMPSETHRRAAEDIYRAQPSKTLAAMLTGAAYMSAGGIGPRNAATPIAAKNFVTPRLVSTVVYLASTMKDVQHYEQIMQTYVLLGEQVAQGHNLWPHDASPASALRIDLGGPLHVLAGPHRHVAARCDCEVHA